MCRILNVVELIGIVDADADKAAQIPAFGKILSRRRLIHRLRRRRHRLRIVGAMRPARFKRSHRREYKKFETRTTHAIVPRHIHRWPERVEDAGRWQEILKWLLTLFFNYAV